MSNIERCTCDRDTLAENMASPDCPAHGPDWQRVAARAVAEKVVLEQQLRGAVEAERARIIAWLLDRAATTGSQITRTALRQAARDLGTGGQ